MGMTAPPELQRLQDRIDELERERARLLGMIEILRDVSGALHYPDIVQAVARRLGHLFGLDRCSVLLSSRTGGPEVYLVASYEDPSIRQHPIDLSHYPEIRRSIETGQVVYIPDALADPTLAGVSTQLASRRVRSITVVPMSWEGHVIGTLFLRTYREGQPFTGDDVEFCRVVAEVTARALRIADLLERGRSRQEEPGQELAERKRAALLALMHGLMSELVAQERNPVDPLLSSELSRELDRLIAVAISVIGQESQAEGDRTGSERAATAGRT